MSFSNEWFENAVIPIELDALSPGGNQSKYMFGMEERTFLENECRRKGLVDRQQEMILEFETGDSSAK